MTAVSTMTVRVDDVREVSAEATWGQRAMWYNIEWLGPDDPYFNIGGVSPLPPGLGLTDVRDVLTALLRTFESMRTRFTVDADGVLHQHVGPGSIDVTVHRTADPDEADARARALVGELSQEPFRHDTQWPIRLAVVTVDDAPTAFAFVTSRIVFDGAGSRVVAAEMGRLLAGEDPGRHDWQPVDEARWERSAECLGISDAAQQFWATGLASVPLSMFDYPVRAEGQPRFDRLIMRSPAVLAACRRLVERYTVSPAAVALSAMQVVLREFTGHDRLAMQIICGNRVGEQRMAMVGTLSQDGLYTRDVAGCADFGALVRDTYQATVETFVNGFYDPVVNRQLRQRERTRCGGHVDLAAYFNDSCNPAVFGDPSFVVPERIASLLDDTTVELDASFDRVDARLFLTCADAPGAMLVYLLGDSRYLSRDEMSAFLYAVERVLVAAADGELPADRWAAVAAMPSVERGAGWIRCRQDGWLDLAALGTAFAAVRGGSACEVFAHEAGTGYEVVGYTVAGPDDDPAAIHERLMAALDGRTDIRCPDRYVLCTAAPRDRTDQRAWASAGAHASGAGH
jgi:hypothetical protein